MIFTSKNKSRSSNLIRGVPLSALGLTGLADGPFYLKNNCPAPGHGSQKTKGRNRRPASRATSRRTASGFIGPNAFAGRSFPVVYEPLKTMLISCFRTIEIKVFNVLSTLCGKLFNVLSTQKQLKMPLKSTILKIVNVINISITTTNYIIRWNNRFDLLIICQRGAGMK